METCLISIIVPIYNPGKYLYKCLESLVNQTKKNYEVVLVDDGSTDGSEKICKEYCQNYDNFHYFYKENTGVSDTRNFGIEKSCGEYITFVDSDDYIDEKYTEKAEKIIKQNYEMIIFNLVNVKGENKENVVFMECSQDVTCPKVLDKYFKTYYLSSSCKILYKKSMIISNNILFKKDLNYGEDMLFSIVAYVNSKKTYYLNYCGYYYMINENSATQTDNIEKRKKHCIDNLELYRQIGMLLEEKNVVVNEDLYLDALLRNFVSGLSCLWSIKSEYRQSAINEILELYKPYLAKYNKKKSKLDAKLKIQLELLKCERIFLLDVYFKIKRMLK